MRRPALAQVELDRVRAPGPAAVAHHDEVDGEAAQHPLGGKALADPRRLARDRAGVARSAGKRQPRYCWPLGPPSSWSWVESSSTSPSGVTRSCTLGLRISAPRTRSSTIPPSRGERGEVVLERAPPGPRRPSRARAPAPRPPRPPRPGSGRPARSTEALPRPATPSLSLTIARSRPSPGGATARMSTSAATTSSSPRTSSRPRGCVTLGRREQPAAARSWCRTRAGAGRHRRAGCRGRAPGRAPPGWWCRARGGERSGFGMSARIRARMRGRSSSFTASGRADPSSAATMCSRAAGLARDDAGQQGEVVVDDRFGHRAAGDVDHAQARLAQQQEQEQHPLLEGLDDRAGLRGVGVDRRHDDDRLVRLVGPHPLPDGDQALLQAREAGAALLLAQARSGARCSSPRPRHPDDVVDPRRPEEARAARACRPARRSPRPPSRTWTRWLIRIWPGPASAHSRAARLVTLPIAA